MRVWMAGLLAVASLAGQQLEFINQKVGGKAARDAQGNWIFAEAANPGIRLRKLSADRTQTVFDKVTGGSGVTGISALQVDGEGNAYLLGVTTSSDFPTTANAPWPSYNGSFGTSYFLKLDGSGAIVTSTYLLTSHGVLVARDFAAAPNGDWMIAAPAASSDQVRANGIEVAGEGTLLLLRLNHDGTVLRGGRWLDARRAAGGDGAAQRSIGQFLCCGFHQ